MTEAAGGAGAAIVGVILAGGLARRMGGGDKGERRLAGRPLLAHVIERLAPQVDRLVLNANGDPARFAAYGLPVIADPVPDAPGPLAGILAGLEWARATAGEEALVISAPVDAPLLPADLVARLRAAARPLSCAASGGRRHPVIGLWPVGIADALRRALVEEDIRKIDRFTATVGTGEAAWPAEPVDPFLNVNRPDDLAEAERLLAARDGKD